MLAGKRRHRIRIEKRKDVVDNVGQSVPRWSSFAAEVPASFDPKAGREYFAALGAVVTEAAVFGIVYRPGIVPEMRVKFDDKVWDIANVENVAGRNRDLLLYCATGLTAG